MRRVLALVVLFTASGGCAWIGSAKYRSYPENPYPDLRTIAILPFINRTDVPIDGAQFANTFASEMVKFGGFRVVRPAQIRAALQAGETVDTVEDAIELGRRVDADAILAAAVTDYDPYYPPRLALSVQLFRVRVRDSGPGDDLDRIVQVGSWRHIPFEINDDRLKNVAAAFETMYDTHKDDVRSEVAAYSAAQETADYPYTEAGDEILNLQDRLWQFVSARAIHQLIDLARVHGR